LLDNRAGSGWPDVVFAEPNLIADIADSAHHYPADLTPYVSQDIVNNFAPGSLASCTINGKLYCLRNDLAQNMLWYNTKLLQQFGYTVPTTWEDYQALGLKVAKEHPGYVIGAFGDANAYYEYFIGSGCPTAQMAGTETVHINMADSHCTQMANLLDPLLADGAIAKFGAFDPGFVKLGTQDKILMMVAPSWFGQYVFKPTYKTPNGEIVAGLPLRWSSESTARTGFWGGAAWAISSHSTNPKGAADIAIWMSTSNAYQGTAPTFPAYLPAADTWHQTVANDPFYATDPYPALKQAAGLIDPSAASVRYDPQSLFGTVVIPAILKGQTISSTFPTYQSQLAQLARASGYTVVTS